MPHRPLEAVNRLLIEATCGGPSTGSVIGGILGALAFIGIVTGIIFLIRKRQEDREGPPKHKPPPPVKAGSSTEMNMDDETTGALNGDGPPVLDDSAKYVNELKDCAADGHHGNDLDSSNHEPPVPNISRGESFVSSAIELKEKIDPRLISCPEVIILA
ncbi:hypothetical protein PAMA_011879 [Pampus argenteus]